MAHQVRGNWSESQYWNPQTFPKNTSIWEASWNKSVSTLVLMICVEWTNKKPEFFWLDQFDQGRVVGFVVVVVVNERSRSSSSLLLLVMACMSTHIWRITSNFSSSRSHDWKSRRFVLTSFRNNKWLFLSFSSLTTTSNRRKHNSYMRKSDR